MRKSFSLVCALGLATAAIAQDAQAMPTTPLGTVIEKSLTTKVNFRCGEGWHSRVGGCVRNGGRKVQYRAH